VSPKVSDIIASLNKLATEFRAAIERCPRDRLPIGFREFPAGACGDASLLLARYLEENGHTGFFYVLGMRNGGFHAWLSKDGLVIDITADQFSDQHQAVIVALASRWHGSFRVDRRDEFPENFGKWDKAAAATLANAYRMVMSQLR
jgi:hypothetical protein